MDLEAITCGICKNEYNLTNRLPRLMMNCCGESVCTDCIRRILQSQSEFRCPYDNTPYIILDGDAEAFVINPTLKRLLEKRAEKEKCPEHKDEYRFKCDNCKRNVCDVCIHSGKHKGHDLISLKQAQSEANRKQKELELKLEDLSGTYKGIDTALKKSESEFLETLHMRFKEIRERVDNTERRLGIEINKFFEVERTAVKNNLGPESALRRTTIDLVEYLKRSKAKELPETKKHDISQILISLNAIISQNQAQVYAQTGKRYLNAFDSSLMHATDALSKLEFPTREFAKKFESYTIIETPPKIAVGNTSPPHTINNNNVPAFPAVIPTVTVRDPMHMEINHAFRVVIKNNSIMYLTAKKIFVKTEPSADLGLEVEKWGKINKLKIRLESDMVSDDKLEALGYICSRLDELKRIEMICQPEGLNEEHFLKFFSKVIQKPKNLQEIDFNFKRCKINDKNMNTLTDAYISKMKELDIVRLNLASTFVTHVSIRNLMAKLHPVMKHLVEFELDLTKTKYEDLNDLPLFGDLKNLKRFALILYFTKMTDVGLEAFLDKTINNMKTIQDFSLDLSGTIASQVTLSHLLVAMPTIKTFELRLSNTKTTDKDLKLFTQKPLASMKHIEDLSLDLRETQVTDVSVGELIGHLPKVKNLKLMFGSMKISDINLNGLGNKLNTMKSLVTLELDFENAKISEEGIVRLFVILPNLQNFSLNLAETPITDPGLKVFVEKSLVYMKSLRSFSMNLSKTRVGDQSINSLLTQMKSVNSFRLYLQGTEVSDRGVETFVKNIKKILKSLEEFEMDLTNTNVSSMILTEIKELKKQLAQNALSY